MAKHSWPIAVEGDHGKGRIPLTADLFKSVVANFKGRTHYDSVPIREGHRPSGEEAAGHVTDLFTRKDERGVWLWADVEVTSETAAKIKEKKLTGRSIGLTPHDNGYALNHLALTGNNHPVIRGMQPLQNFSEGGEGDVSLWDYAEFSEPEESRDSEGSGQKPNTDYSSKEPGTDADTETNNMPETNFAEQNAALQKEIERLRKVERENFSLKASTAVKGLGLPPAGEAAMLKFAQACAGDESLSFSEDATVQESLFGQVIEVVKACVAADSATNYGEGVLGALQSRAAQPEQAPKSEFATMQDYNDAVLARAEKLREGTNLSFADALSTAEAEIQKENS